MIKKIRILYFGPLREQRRVSSETISTSASQPTTLYEQLRRDHGFALERRHLGVAVNDELCAWNRVLQDGDHVAFLPPVSGG